MLFIAFNSLNFIIFLHKNNLENILQANPVFVWFYMEILPLGYKQGRKRGGGRAPMGGGLLILIPHSHFYTQLLLFSPYNV